MVGQNSHAGAREKDRETEKESETEREQYRITDAGIQRFSEVVHPKNDYVQGNVFRNVVLLDICTEQYYVKLR